ncbi:hypothetical protein F4694_005764 [Bacillus niacini]|uniref:Uncharacterized protein n=1 Tax=Neobacillus niacini TaxID=86668 RepID=A0A852TN67_9BACI|nr:hypothetical protein [Neobacillus niacini]
MKRQWSIRCLFPSVMKSLQKEHLYPDPLSWSINAQVKIFWKFEGLFFYKPWIFETGNKRKG